MNKKLEFGLIVLLILSFLFICGCTNHAISPKDALSKEYMDFALGVSMKYPESIEPRAMSSLGYFDFMRKTAFKPTYEDKVLEVRLISDKFDRYNHYETYTNDNVLRQLEAISFIPSAEAATAYKQLINDIKDLDVNGLSFYTYSFMDRDYRYDIFIYALNDSYYRLQFLNQKTEFIQKIMESVRFFDSIYSDVFQNGYFINNSNINLKIVVVPRGWQYSNSQDKTELQYNGKYGNATLQILLNDSSELAKYLKETCDGYPSNEWKNGKRISDEEIEAYLKENFNCDSVGDGSTSTLKALYCILPKTTANEYEAVYYLGGLGGLKLLIKEKYSPTNNESKDALEEYLRYIRLSLGFWRNNPEIDIKSMAKEALSHYGSI